MGSKNLKAVAVRGKNKVPAADPKTLNSLARSYVEKFPQSWVNHLSQYGTAVGVAAHQVVGGFPTHNYQEGTFAGWENLSGERLAETILKERDTCYACPVSCKRVVEIQEGPFPVDAEYGGPEYESIGAFGPMCGVSDLAAISRANMLCNAYGMDTISAGVTIAWAMDCYERGLITTQDTGGLPLTYGDPHLLVQLVEMMGKREGFGDLLSLGSRRAAQAIGRGTIEHAVQVKGLELPMHEPRVKYGLGIGYAVSPTGADHNHNFHDSDYTTPKSIEPLKPFGIFEPLAYNDLSAAKMKLASVEIPWSVVMNMMGFCGFIYTSYDRPALAELINAVTGWDLSIIDMLRAGERAFTLARIFNLREGFGRKDDCLPPVIHQPFSEGPAKGNFLDPRQVEEALSNFYSLMGWDPVNGNPTLERLNALNIAWAAKYLPNLPD
jgi:aldehyde:ferredoxin oxidoreductase